MDISHKKYLNLLRKLRAIKGVKKVFIRSGIRFDYLINDKDDTFFYELCKYHVSGQLKVAPEHISDNVLKYMGKPENSVFNKFSDKFYKINEKIGKKNSIWCRILCQVTPEVQFVTRYVWRNICMNTI